MLIVNDNASDHKEMETHIKPLYGFLAYLLAVVLIPACTDKEDTTSGAQEAAGGSRTQDEVLVEKTIIELASRGTEFPRTKDPQSILRFYSQDYAGISNAQPQSLRDIEKYLSELLDRINLGESIRVSAKVSNITTRANGPLG